MSVLVEAAQKNGKRMDKKQISEHEVVIPVRCTEFGKDHITLMLRESMATWSNDDGETVLEILSDMQGGVIIEDSRNPERREQWHFGINTIMDAYLAMRKRGEPEFEGW